MSAVLKPPFKRILIVEDEEAIQKYYSKVLSNFGFDIMVCSDGQEAIDVLDVFRPDVAIVDLVMPIKNGVELLKVIENDSILLERTKVITGGLFSLKQDERDYLKELGIPIRLKPIGPKDLVELISMPNKLPKNP